MEFSFYHLTSTELYRAIHQLADKINATGKKLLILCHDEMQLKELDQSLWSLGRISFLPHATIFDALNEQQPILLTLNIDLNPNNADFIMNLSTNDFASYDKFEKIMYIFHANDEEMLEMARTRWKNLKDYNPIYYKQDDKGVWVKNG